MKTFSFGASEGEISQISFVVEDIDETISSFASDFGVGPWRRYRIGPEAGGIVYRGNPARYDMSIAFSFSGALMIELIQQHCDAPSVFRDHIEKVGYGLHHVARCTVHFDDEAKKFEAAGRELVYSARTSGGSRLAFFERSAQTPAFLELIEIDAATEGLYGALRAAAAVTGGTTAVWEG